MSKVNKLKNHIEKVTGSRTFCVIPWVHVSTETDGTMRLCCASNTKGVVSDDDNQKIKIKFNKTTISDQWNNKYYRDIRNEMLSSKEPIDCQKCFEQEKLGIVSKRLWETREWINDIDTVNLTDLAEPPIYLDLRLGNTCNLKCVMCSPKDSSQWAADYKLLSDEVKKIVPWNKNQNNQFWFRSEFKNDLYNLIPNLKQIQFAGGEPLMIPEHEQFIQEIIKLGHSKNIILKYNTNGLLINDKMIDYWNHFKKVKVSISLDGIYQRGEYIRYPLEWNKLYNNLKKLDETSDTIDVNIAVTVQLLNIKHLIDFAKWKILENFKKINLEFIEEYQIGGGIFNMHLLYIPTFLSIQVLPEFDKEQIRKDFLEFKIWLNKNYKEDFWNNPLGWNKWEAILNYMDLKDRSNLLPQFKKYINDLDQIRCTDVKKTFPELAHLFS